MLLDLRDRGLDADGLRSLLAAAPSDAQELQLDGNPLEDAGVDLLRELLASRRLHRLTLRRTGVGDEGFVRLATCDACSELTELDVAENDLGQAGLAALCRAAWFARLRSLDLSLNYFGDAGLAVLAQINRPTTWQSLGLGNVGLRDQGLAHLAGSHAIENVAVLDLGNYNGYPEQNVLTDAGLAALAASSYCARLARLNLTETGVSATGIGLLLQSASLPRLERIVLSSCWRFDADVRRGLAARFGSRVQF